MNITFKVHINMQLNVSMNIVSDIGIDTQCTTWISEASDTRMILAEHSTRYKCECSI